MSPQKLKRGSPSLPDIINQVSLTSQAPEDRSLDSGLGRIEKVRKSLKLQPSLGAEARARASGWPGGTRRGGC